MQKLKLSVMTGKLSGITGINTSSLDNAFCQSMSQKKYQCYLQILLFKPQLIVIPQEMPGNVEKEW